MADYLYPVWPAPANVRALQTCRSGGVSQAPWDSLNLGDHVGDDPAHVEQNRMLLSQHMPEMPVWLTQVHGVDVVEAANAPESREADAVITRSPGKVCAVMTADCLPVLLCDRRGTVVAAAHAGWRGLAAGVLEKTIAAMAVAPKDIIAWLGPAIGPASFEVGDEVRTAFIGQDAQSASAFHPLRQGKWLANIYALARLRLGAAGLRSVSGGEHCTFAESTRFFSYRRDGVTGRMATMIWMVPNESV